MAKSDTAKPMNPLNRPRIPTDPLARAGELGLAEVDREVLRICLHEGLIPKGSHILVGVSGGGDSLALLYALTMINRTTDSNWSITILHVSHGESREDREALNTVEWASSRLRHPMVHRGELEGERPDTRPNESEQMQARRHRYALFQHVAEELGCTVVAFGHTLDDQAETVLMRLTAGHWVTGMAGMPVTRPLCPGVAIVRPLLSLRRSVLRRYLSAHGQPWFEDPSNQESRHRRNAIRDRVLPMLEDAMQRNVAENLAILARQAGELAAWLGAQARVWLEANAVQRPTKVGFPSEALGALPSPLAAEVVRLALLDLGAPIRRVTLRRINAILSAARNQATGPWDILLGTRARYADGMVWLEHMQEIPEEPVSRSAAGLAESEELAADPSDDSSVISVTEDGPPEESTLKWVMEAENEVRKLKRVARKPANPPEGVRQA